MMGSWIFGGIWMIIIWIVIIALIVWGVIALVRYLGRGSGQTVHHSSLDVVKERYARGEISREEFERIKKDIA